MKAELVTAASNVVRNPQILVNMVSRRVRQLNGLSGGAPARPLISETAGLGAADIALLEIAEGKLGWEFIVEEEAKPEGTKRKAA